MPSRVVSVVALIEALALSSFVERAKHSSDCDDSLRRRLAPTVVLVPATELWAVVSGSHSPITSICMFAHLKPPEKDVYASGKSTLYCEVRAIACTCPRSMMAPPEPAPEVEAEEAPVPLPTAPPVAPPAAPAIEAETDAATVVPTPVATVVTTAVVTAVARVVAASTVMPISVSFLICR